MIMKRKKFLAMLLSMAMCFSLIPASVINSVAATEENPVKLIKTLIDMPAGSPDEIKLEAYVTGQIKESSGKVPTDIVLVLDQSGSMDDPSVEGNSSSLSKLAVMKDAVESFTKQVQELNVNNDDTYRVAIVGFAGTDTNTEILTLNPIRQYYDYVKADSATLDRDENYYIKSGNSYKEISWYEDSWFGDEGWYTVGFLGGRDDYIDVSETTVYDDNVKPQKSDYENALVDCSSANIAEGGIIDNAIDALDGYGATRADLGMEMAKGIFDAQPEGTYKTRKKLVVFLTDGVPTTSNNFSETVANTAVSYAKSIKADGANIFSLYFGNPVDEAAKFLQAVSSNYANAENYTDLDDKTGETYYAAHSSSSEIMKVFTDIIYSIASDASLDERAVVADALTEYFRLADTAGASYNTKQIRVYTVDKTADGWADDEVLYENAKIKISDEGKTISVSGFNFSYYCVTDKPKVEGGNDYGKKLVIYIPIAPDNTADTYGGYLPTNVSAGVYEDEEAQAKGESKATAESEVNDVDFNYVIGHTERWYHIDSNNTYTFTFDADTMDSILDEMILADYIPDGINNEGVTLEYAIYDTNNTSMTENEKNDDEKIATLTVAPGEALDVTDFTEWDVLKTTGTITIPDGTLTTDRMYVVVCKLTCTDTVTPQTKTVYGLIDVGISKDEDSHNIGGIGDFGVILTVPEDAPGGKVIENTYRETVKVGSSSAVLTFTLKDGYEFSKIIVKETKDSALDTVTEYDAPLFDGLTITDGVYTWQADNITGAEAVEVYTKIKNFNLVTEGDGHATIASSTSYPYSTTNIRVPFSADNGYEIKTLSVGKTKDTAVTYTAEELVAKDTEELKNLGIEIVTADSYDASGNPKKIIVSGAAEFSRTDNSYAAVTTDTRTYQLTYKQYKEHADIGYIEEYTAYGQDAVYYVKFGDALPEAPVAPGTEQVIDNDNHTLSAWYKNYHNLEFSGITNVLTTFMPAGNLVLHAFWRENPNINVGKITVNKDSVGTYDGNKEFEFVAVMHEAVVGNAKIKVSSAAPQASAEIELILSDLQNDAFENGAVIRIYENVPENDTLWIYDNTEYTYEYSKDGNVLKNGEQTVATADFVNAYNSYTVEYDLNGGTIGGQSTIAPKTVKWSDRGLTPTGTPSMVGYMFEGWKYKDTVVTGSNVYSALVGNDVTVTSIKLVAQYKYDEDAEVNKYTVKYDLNGGKLNGSETVESKLVKFTEAGLLPDGTPVREDYKFMGYKYGITMVEPTTTYAALAQKDTVKEITLVAQWELDKKGEQNPEEPDNIEDKYQKTIIFKILNGTWSNDTAEDLVYVVTLKDDAGNADETGKASISHLIPAGMKPIGNYDAKTGSWREVPPAEVTGTQDATYTYVFHKTPDITYDEHDEPEPKPQTEEVKENDKIMVDPNGGIWTYENASYEKPVTLTLTDNIDLGKPVRENYVFTGWTKTAGTGEIVWVFTANWEEDRIGEKEPEKPDEIPDKYQKKVYFEVLNGKWADNTTNKKLVVLTLRDDAGKYDVNGSAQLEAPTGMKANSGYDMPGAWREVPPAKVTGTADETYTYVFHKTPDITYDEYDEPEPKPETEEVEENDYIKVDPNGGVWTFGGNDYTTAQRIKMVENIDLGKPVRENYKFMGWIKTAGTGDIVWVFTAQWTEDKIGKEDPEKPDDIADKYQKKVIFKVLNGTWADGTTEDIVLVLDLLDENGKYSESGKAGLVAPTGMNANSGYDMPGAWREIPPAEIVGTETATFTYVFHKTPDVTYDKYEEPEPVPETEEFAEHEYILVKPNGGTWTFNGTEYTEDQKIEMLENIDLGTPVRENYKFMGWEMTDGTGDIVKVFTAMWELDEKGTKDPEKPDDIADVFQKTVIFKVENGTWADGTEEALTYVVDLKDENGKYARNGKADISELIPMGMKRKIGYTDGAWNEEIPAEVTGSETVTYTYSFKKNEGGGGGITPVTKYTLTYETNGGSEISKQSYASGTAVNLTKRPTKAGFAFEGWYLDAELTEYVTKVTMTKDITVYAAWVEDNGNAGNSHQTPGSLNSEEHFAYVIGYPDGTVKPENHIMRSEVTAIFFRLLTDDARNYNISSENNFNDVQIGAWYNTAVSTMAKLNIIKGKEANKFDPDAYITRAEFAAICARFDDSEFEVVDSFSDVSGHWAEDEIHEAAAHGWIRGYSDTEFKPDALITRAEAMTMINRVLNRIPETTEDLDDDMIKWPDNDDTDAWYYIAVQEATNGHTYEMKNHIYEKWNSITDAKDWSIYQ